MKTYLIPASLIVRANTREEADAAAVDFQVEANHTCLGHLSRPLQILLDETLPTVQVSENDEREAPSTLLDAIPGLCYRHEAHEVLSIGLNPSNAVVVRVRLASGEEMEVHTNHVTFARLAAAGLFVWNDTGKSLPPGVRRLQKALD